MKKVVTIVGVVAVAAIALTIIIARYCIQKLTDEKNVLQTAPAREAALRKRREQPSEVIVEVQPKDAPVMDVASELQTNENEKNS